MQTERSEITEGVDPTIQASATTSVAEHIKGAKHDDSLSGDRIELTFYSGESDISKLPIFLGLNGVGYNIPRDKMVSIPIEVFNNCVANAVEEHVAQTKDGIVSSNRPRYSYQIGQIVRAAKPERKRRETAAA